MNHDLRFTKRSSSPCRDRGQFFLLLSRITYHASRGALFALLLISTLCSLNSARAATPFSFQFYNSDGSPQTNAMTMTAWPPSTNAWTVYGSNIIWGSQSITLTPGSNGYGTNFAFPNSYRIIASNLNSGFYVLLPDTAAQIPLGACLVDVPHIAGPLSFYGMITNWLGFAPVASNYASIANAVGFTPATNGVAALTNNLTDAALVSIHGYRPATNGIAALTNTLTDAALVSIHGYRPATNGLAALTNILTDAALVSIHGYRPATNGIEALTNTLTDDALVGIHGYRPATNGLVALTNTLTSSGLLSVLGTIPENYLPQIGYIGVTNLNGAMLTNRATGQIICWTNLVAGTNPTIDLPDGSLIIATNGNLYIRSNSTPVNLK